MHFRISAAAFGGMNTTQLLKVAVYVEIKLLWWWLVLLLLAGLHTRTLNHTEGRP